MAKDDGREQIATRVPRPLYKKLERLAKRNRRSVSAELAVACEEHVEVAALVAEVLKAEKKRLAELRAKEEL